MAEVTLGTLYEINKNLLSTIAPVSKTRMKKDFTDMGAWMSKFPSARYFMLLCKERSDYTIFHFNGSYDYTKAIKEIQEVLEERGTLLGINYVHGEDTYECWVREEGEEPEVYMFLLFDADWMIVEI